MNFKNGKMEKVFSVNLLEARRMARPSQEKSSKSSGTLQERTNDFKFQFKGGVSRLQTQVRKEIN